MEKPSLVTSILKIIENNLERMDKNPSSRPDQYGFGRAIRAASSASAYPLAEALSTSTLTDEEKAQVKRECQRMGSKYHKEPEVALILKLARGLGPGN